MENNDVVDRNEHEVLGRHFCKCSWQGDDMITHIIDAMGQGDYIVIEKSEYNELLRRA